MRRDQESIDRIVKDVNEPAVIGGIMAMGSALDGLSENDVAATWIALTESHLGHACSPEEIEQVAIQLDGAAEDLKKTAAAVRRRAHGPVLRVIQGGEDPK